VLEADLILHVRDMSDPDNGAQAKDVMRILEDLGIDEKEASEKIIEVWNKVDALELEAHEAMLQRVGARRDTKAVSALTGEGVSELMNEISIRLSGVLTETTVVLRLDQLQYISWVYENAMVVSREDREDGTVALDVRLSGEQASMLERKLGIIAQPEKEDWERDLQIFTNQMKIGLDVVEPASKLRIGAAQSIFWINALVAADIDQRKDQITQLIRDCRIVF
jgi:GTP-binding protein HflX